MKHFLGRYGWSGADKLAAAISALGIALYLVHGWLGHVEGRYLPVVKDFTVTVVDASEAATRIEGGFDILRPGCDFIGVEWFLVGEARRAKIAVTFEEGEKVRPGGWQAYGPWRLPIPPQRLYDTEAFVLHKCPYRPWLTVTRLFP